MKEYAHTSISVGIGTLLLSLLNYFIKIGILFFFFFFFFIIISKANDWLDFKLFKKHERKFLTHSPLSPLLIGICIVSGVFFSIFNIILGIYIAFIIYIIFFTHFFLDALNPSGAPFFPRKQKIHLKAIPFNNIKWNLIIFLIGLLMTFIAIFQFLIA
ncbi:MAG: hypothetical protein ACTSPD_07360 [Promethearchaeota archaeon]